MIEIQFKDKMHLQFNTKNYDFLKALDEKFAVYADNYRFQPKYKAGVWDGKVHFFVKDGRYLPFGLFTDVLRFIKEHFPEEELVIDEKLIEYFNQSKSVTFKWNLCYQPYEYQEDCIRTAVARKKGIIQVGTGGGKSLIISYLYTTLRDNKLSKKFLIIVPSIGLISQFKSDMLEYGIPEEEIGCVWADEKDWDKPVIVSTWQSLMNYTDKLIEFDAVVCDECHITKKSMEVKKLLQLCTSAKYKFGFTGTVPSSEIENLNVRSYLGPVLRHYSVKYLTDKGFLSKCIVKSFTVKYKKKIKTKINVVDERGNHETKLKPFSDIRAEVFAHKTRLKLIANIIKDAGDKTVLVLVNLREKEGEVLKEYLERSGLHSNRTVKFINGSTKLNDRESVRLEANSDEGLTLITTYPIFQAGVNIPRLQHVILASPSESEVRVIQTIGRSLRKHSSKEEGAFIYDIVDDCYKNFLEHSRTREQYYRIEEHPIKRYCVIER